MTKQTDEKRRKDRDYQRSHRGSKRSYVTEIENLRILLAWEAGVPSEGQAARAIGTDRVSLREMKIEVLNETQAWYLKFRQSLNHTQADPVL